MNSESLRKTSAALAAGLVLTGCSTANQEDTEHSIHGVEDVDQNIPAPVDAETDTPPVFMFEGNPAQYGRSTEIGVDPDALPHEDIELDGNRYDSEGMTVYQWFSQLHIEDNEIRFTALPEVGPRTSEVLRTTLDESRFLIRAGIERGTLERILFTKDVPAEKPGTTHYNSVARVVAINFDEQQLTYDELSAKLRHELWHAVTLDMPNHEAAREALYDEFCDELDNLYAPEAMDYIETVMHELITVFYNQRKEHPQEYVKYIPVIREMAERIDEGDAADDLQIYCGRLSVQYTLDELRRSVLEPNEDATTASLHDSRVIRGLAATHPVRRAVTREFVGENTFHDDINESTYVRSDTPGSRYLGHASSNWAELHASLLNVATYYTDAFARKVNAMHSTERAYIRSMLDIVIRETVAENPSLEDELSSTKAELLSKINGK